MKRTVSLLICMTTLLIHAQTIMLNPGEKITKSLSIEPASIYNLSVIMKTESGSDSQNVQVDGLGKYGVSCPNSMSNWTKIERTLLVSDTVKKINVVFEASENNDFKVFFKDMKIERIGDFEEKHYTGIPPRKQRNTITDLGISMQPDSVIQWMRNDRLGMFIHWGLYAGPGKGEWYMENNGILPEQYNKLAYPESGDEYFDAANFDATKWTELAKRAGFRYVCLTTQHHDGFALFESHATQAFTSWTTHHKDFVREFVEACRKSGLRVGFYKTLINWQFPGYYDINGDNCQKNKFGYTTAAWHKENAQIMKKQLYEQTNELMTNYGTIDYLFWDGGWIAQKGSDADGASFWESGKLMQMVRKYQPNIICNPRCGWVGDITIEEGGNDVRGEIRNGLVEKCMTINGSWGYNKSSGVLNNITPLKRIKKICCDCMVRGMNFLVNVGPDRHGDIPLPVIQRIEELGLWINSVSDAIYDTEGGPWEPLDGQYGFTTKDNKIFIYIMDGYNQNDFQLPPLDKGMKVMKAYRLDNREKVKYEQHKTDVQLFGLPLINDDVTIICIELNKNVRSNLK